MAVFFLEEEMGGLRGRIKGVPASLDDGSDLSFVELVDTAKSYRRFLATGGLKRTVVVPFPVPASRSVSRLEGGYGGR